MLFRNHQSEAGRGPRKSGEASQIGWLVHGLARQEWLPVFLSESFCSNACRGRAQKDSDRKIGQGQLLDAPPFRRPRLSSEYVPKVSFQSWKAVFLTQRRGGKQRCPQRDFHFSLCVPPTSPPRLCVEKGLAVHTLRDCVKSPRSREPLINAALGKGTANPRSSSLIPEGAHL